MNVLSLTAVMPTASVMLTVSGYVYCQMYFGNFGINTPLLFTLSDYLASSIEQIGIAVLSTVGLLLAMVHAYVTGPTKPPPPIGRRGMIQKINREMPSVYFALFAFLAYLYSPPVFFRILPIIALAASAFILPKIVTKYFDNPMPVAFFLLYMTTFFSGLYGQSQAMVYALESGEGDDFTLMTSEDNYSKETGHGIIGGNSRCVFILDMNSNESLVISKDSIIEMSIPFEARGDKLMPFHKLRSWLMAIHGQDEESNDQRTRD